MGKRIRMNGYVPEKREHKTINGDEIEIITYQGEHCDEYLMKEVKSGRCSLFYKGILKLNWKEVDGVQNGGYTVYDKGKALSQDWNELDGKEYRYIENSKNRLELVIEGNGVIYRGGFDSLESMKREGKGMEVDEKSGKVLRCGVWKNDELFQVIQEIESDEVMIEYEVEEGEENVSVLNRHPVYEGGYVFDEATSSHLRHGDGYEIEGGVAVSEGKWENGELVESVDLFDGWYVKMEENNVLTWERKVDDMRVEIHNLTELQNVDERITELVIPSNCCNENEWSVFDVSGLKWLKCIEIGDECFANVDEVKLIGLNKLERVLIGKNSFTKNKNSCGDDPNRHFYLKDCERLKELKIGSWSFSDYSVCEIANVNRLEVIEMGDLNETSANFCYASLELKSADDRMK